MPLTKLTLTTGSGHTRLDETLAAWLTERLGRTVSKAKARKLIMAGGVFLNGHRVRIPPQSLRSGTKLEANIDFSKLFGDSTSKDKPFEVTSARILFEDDDLIVVDKPPGLPSQPTVDPARDHLLAAVTRFLSRRDHVSKPYLGVHQRLDRDTSGIVLFTKSTRANAGMSEIFSKHLGTKTYQAITIAGTNKDLPRQWTIRNVLGKAAKYAETSFRVIAAHAHGTHVEAIPKTGRTHQIRVHLSEYGLPILGDDLYGAEDKAPRLMLHASGLLIPHPLTKQQVSIVSPLPADFKECLRKIQAVRRHAQ